MNILVTGSNGQLGSEINDLAANYTNFTFFFMDLPALDICNSSQLDAFFKDDFDPISIKLLLNILAVIFLLFLKLLKMKN